MTEGDDSSPVEGEARPSLGDKSRCARDRLCGAVGGGGGGASPPTYSVRDAGENGLAPDSGRSPLGGRRCQAVATAAVGNEMTALRPANGRSDTPLPRSAVDDRRVEPRLERPQGQGATPEAPHQVLRPLVPPPYPLRGQSVGDEQLAFRRARSPARIPGLDDLFCRGVPTCVSASARQSRAQCCVCEGGREFLFCGLNILS